MPVKRTRLAVFIITIGLPIYGTPLDRGPIGYGCRSLKKRVVLVVSVVAW
jgi:hypothetical protein